MIITQAVLDALRVDLSSVFDGAVSAAPTWSDSVVTGVPSTTSKNVYAFIMQQVKLREWLGPRTALNLTERKFELTNKKFEGTIEIPREAIEDEGGIISYRDVMTKQLGEAAKQHPDVLLEDLLLANPTAFDGVSLFNDAHPTYDDAGTTYDNNFALALDETNFNTVWSTMASYKGEDGRSLGVMPDTMIVPPQLKLAALKLFKATSNSSGASNMLQGWIAPEKILVVPRLSSAPATWYLADCSKVLKPFIRQNRQAPEFVARFSTDDPKVFDNDVFTYGVRYRSAVGPTLPFLIAKSAG